MGKYTHKKRIYGGIPPTPPPLPPSYKKTAKTVADEKKFERRLAKIYEKMKEEDEDERRAEREDSLMLWAVRGTGKKFKPISKRWKTVVSHTQSKRKGGKKTIKHTKSKTHKKYRK
jgi:hypothetical protein